MHSASLVFQLYSKICHSTVITKKNALKTAQSSTFLAGKLGLLIVSSCQENNTQKHTTTFPNDFFGKRLEGKKARVYLSQELHR
jgi:hypothetical protein